MEKPVNVGKIFTEKKIEYFIIFRRMLVSIPPEPIAPFRTVNLLPGRLSCRKGKRRIDGNGAFQEIPRPPQAIPGMVLLGRPDPNPKILIDPGARVNVIQSLQRGEAG